MDYSELWSKYFSLTSMISLAKIEDTFRPYFAAIKDGQHLYLFDQDNSDMVSKTIFVDVMTKFGPVNMFAGNVNECFSHAGFQGYITSDQAVKLLRTEEKSTNIDGTYTLRISSPGTSSMLTIDYIASPGQPKSIEVFNLPSHGFSKAANDTAHALPTLKEFLASIPELKSPYSRQLARYKAFHWELQSKEAESTLDKAPVGSFLIRFSSGVATGVQTGQFSIAYVGDNGKVAHSHLPLLPNGGYEVGKTKYDTFDSMITNSSFFRKNDKPFAVTRRVLGEPQATKRAFASVSSGLLEAPVTLNYGRDDDDEPQPSSGSDDPKIFYSGAPEFSADLGRGSQRKPSVATFATFTSEIAPPPKTASTEAFPVIRKAPSVEEVTVVPKAPSGPTLETKTSQPSLAVPAGDSGWKSGAIGSQRRPSFSGTNPPDTSSAAVEEVTSIPPNPAQASTSTTNKKHKTKTNTTNKDKDKGKDKEKTQSESEKAMLTALSTMSITDIDELMTLRHSAHNPLVTKMLDAAMQYARKHLKK